MDDQLEITAELCDRAIAYVHARGYTPTWLLLGVAEFAAIRRYLIEVEHRVHGPGTGAPGPIIFHNVRIARVQLQTYIEVSFAMPPAEHARGSNNRPRGQGNVALE